MKRLLYTLSFVLPVTSLLTTGPVPAQESSDWAASVKLPAEEKPIKLFNGKDLDGWEGQTDKYWSVENGVIKGAAAKTAVSSYLFTKKKYREFRLLLEVKQTVGMGYDKIHSAVALLGEKFDDKGDPFSFKGPLVLFCNDWGFYEVNGRKRLNPPGQKGTYAFPGEKVGDWNQIEILVIGDRVRNAANGKLVFDATEMPGVLKESPLGLQVHQTNSKLEYRFKGLILTEHPQDRLVTVAQEEKGK